MTTETFAYDKLIAGEHPRVERVVTVTSGLNLTVGTPIAINTASGNAVVYDNGGAGGDEVLYGVLAQDVDASAADTEGVAFIAGEFNLSMVHALIGGNDTEAAFIAAARDIGIFLRNVQGA